MSQQFCPYCMTPVEPGESCPVCGLTEGSYSPAPHHLPPGTILAGRYLVGRVLGEGGFGITYIGCDLRLELKVAIKEYFPTDRASRHSSSTLDVIRFTGSAGRNYESGKERFLFEARTMARMDKQPQIVGVRDFFESNNTAYIVMEYVAGTNLKELVAQRGGKIPAQELLTTLRPLFSALQEMHERGLIHRDISPDNLMLENGMIRLLDFGCARESADGSETMTIALKQGYAPIEQYQQKGQGPWTDVYALAGTIYYCITGKIPPRAVDRICEDDLILPRKLGVELTEIQEAALCKALTVRPRQRFRSMEEFAAALYAEPEQSRVVAEPAPWPEQRPVEADPPKQEAAAPEPEQTVQQTRFTPEPAMPEPPTPAPEPEPEHTEPQQESAAAPAPEAPQLAIWWKKPWVWAAGCGVLALVLVLAIPRKPKETKALQEAPTTEAIAQESTPQAEPTEQATKRTFVLDGANNSEGVLREKLADNNVGEIIIRDCWLEVNAGPLKINKPLRIEKNAALALNQSGTVVTGGRIEVEGHLEFWGTLRVDGGSLWVAEDAEEFNGMGLLLEHESDVELPQGKTLREDYGFYNSVVVFSEAETFANATHVSSFWELADAMDSSKTTAIVIDRDIELEWNLDQRVPVLIPEGVTVNGMTKEHWNWEENKLWGVDRTVLVNRGTLTAGVQLCNWDGSRSGDSVILNYGTLGRDFFLCPNHDNGDGAWSWGTLYNMASGEVYADYLMSESTSIYNLGALYVQESAPGSASLFDYNWGRIEENAWMFNGGTIRIQGTKERSANLEYNGGGPFFQNAGTLEIGDYAMFTLRGGMMTNVGVVDLQSETAFLSNDGLLRNYGGMNVPSKRCIATDCGVLVDWEPCKFLQPGSTIRFGWAPSYHERTHVRTEQQLREALMDSGCSTVVMDDGMEITLTDDLVIHDKVLAVSSNSVLRLGGHTLTVSGANGGLMADTFRDELLDEGTLIVKDQGTAVVAALGNTMKVSGDSTLLLNQGGTFQNVDIQVENGAEFINISCVTLENSHISVTGKGSRLVTTNELTLNKRGRVEIGKGAQLMNWLGYFNLDKTSSIANQGYLWLIQDNDQWLNLDGSVENQGWIDFSGDINLNGRLFNGGVVQVTDRLNIAGRFENKGSFLLVSGCEVEYQGYEVYSGNLPQQRQTQADARY